MDGDGNLVSVSPEGFSPEELQERLSGVSSPQEAMEALGMGQEEIDYGHGDEMRVASTNQMREIVAEAARLNLNRRLDKYTLDYETFVDESGQLHDDRWHMLTPLLVHSYAQEQPVEPHMRVTAHVFFKDTAVTRPERRILDIPMNLWKRLPTAKSMETPGMKERQKERDRWSRDNEMARRRIAMKEPT